MAPGAGRVPRSSSCDAHASTSGSLSLSLSLLNVAVRVPLSSPTTCTVIVQSARPQTTEEMGAGEQASLGERFAEATQAHARVVDSSVLGLFSGEQADAAEPQDARQALGILHRYGRDRLRGGVQRAASFE